MANKSACSLCSDPRLSSLASSGSSPSSHNRHRAREDATVCACLIQVRTAQHGAFILLRPWLGSYEGRSFICSSLWLRRDRTAKLGWCTCQKLLSVGKVGGGVVEKEAGRRLSHSPLSSLGQLLLALPLTLSPNPWEEACSDPRAVLSPTLTWTISLITLNWICLLPGLKPSKEQCLGGSGGCSVIACLLNTCRWLIVGAVITFTWAFHTCLWKSQGLHTVRWEVRSTDRNGKIRGCK